MKQIQLARSEEGFSLLDDWHRRFEERLTFPRRTERVETTFGFADVMITGPAAESEDSREDPPILVLHGAMAGAPFALGELADLPARRSVYAVNIPGQSTRAAPVRLDFRSDEYARWLIEIMDSLGLERAHVCGVSWGGSVALQLAKYAPERLAGLLLVVPGSMVRGPVIAGLVGVALPMLRYRLRPTRRNLERAFAKLLTASDDLWLDYLGAAVRHWKVDFSVPPLVSREDLAGLQAPVFVIAADRDLSFPGEKVLERARRIFPNLLGTHLLKDSCHSPSNLDPDRVEFAAVLQGALESFQSVPA